MIDCDVHCAPDSLETLLEHMDPYWRSYVEDATIALGDPGSYPPHLRGRLPSSAAELTALLDRDGTDLAIVSCVALDEVHRHPDYATAVARGLNDWMREALLDREPRLRASAVVATTDIEAAAAEIDRVAADPRFVQVLLPAMVEAPLGRRQYWPIYAAAERHGLPVGIHAGSSYRHPVTPVGWPSYYVEDYASQSYAFQGQLGSLIAEGVFNKFPGLKVVLLESGVSWLIPFLWRMTKFWRGTRSEVPWVTRPPIEIARDHVRLSIQPFDAPDDPAIVGRIIEHMQSDAMLLFASDYPHFQYEDDAVLPPGLSEDFTRRLAHDNPLETYPRLKEVQS